MALLNPTSYTEYATNSAPVTQTEVVTGVASTNIIITEIYAHNHSGSQTTLQVLVNPSGGGDVDIVDQTLDDGDHGNIVENARIVVNSSGTVDVNAGAANVSVIITSMRETTA